jgi:aspartate kinase
MSLIVHKYGGTSVGTIERIQAVAARVAESHKAGDKVVVACICNERRNLIV